VKKVAKKAVKKAVAKASKKAPKAAVKKTAKKAVKSVAKKTVRKPIKKIAAKKVVKTAAKKSAGKKVVSKPAAKKIATAKPAIKKAVAKPAIKKPAARKIVAAPVAPVKQTKTAERKAKRAAKVLATAPVKKPRVAKPAAPVWPPVVAAVLKQLDDAKAEQVIAMDLSGKSTIADTMVVASGRSNRHVNAIADQVVDELAKHGFKNIRIEGVPQCDWVLVDAGDVIIHVFRPEVRSFYNLEKLWAANVPE
jgi:ribosome-associated protein